MTHKSVFKRVVLSIAFLVSLSIVVSLTTVAQQKPNAVTSAPERPLFRQPVAYDSGGSLAMTLAVADLNGDGKPDLVAVNYAGEANGDGSVGVLLGNGNGTFRSVVTYDSGGGGPIGIAIGDLDGDGKPDLVVANQGCHGLSQDCVGVLLGNGDGSFQPTVIYPDAGSTWSSAGSIPIMIADVNGDGRLDVVVVSQAGSDFHNGLVSILLGNGDGTFKPVVAYDSGGFAAFSALLTDVNGDGKLDVVVLNCTSSGSTDCLTNQAIVGVLLGNGDGTFQPVRRYPTGGVGGFSPALAVADVSGDGRPDILVGNYCANNNCPVYGGSFGVLLGNGDGTFQPVVTYDTKWEVDSIAVADLNGDGKPDLAVGPPEVWLGNGDGTFRHLASYFGGGQVFLVDINGDGKPDLVTDFSLCPPSGDCLYPASTADVHLGNGDGTFGSLHRFSLGGSLISWATIADVNGDSRPDLLSANWCARECQGNFEGAVGVLLNNTPSCTTPPAITVSASPGSLWPPNGKMVPVKVSGTITDSEPGCTIKTAAYAVTDEYGKIQPSGVVTLGTGGSYNFTLWLQASRLGSDLDGRRYTIVVGATNNSNVAASKSATIIVPHDLGR